MNLFNTFKKQDFQNSFWHNLLIRFCFVVLLLGLWQATHIFAERGSTLFPSPWQVAGALWDGFSLSHFTAPRQALAAAGEEAPQSFIQALGQSKYLPNIGVSVWRLLQGYILSVLIGFPLGLTIARSHLAERTLGWMAISLQSLPSICWIPLAILWFGQNSVAPILFVTVMGSLFATVLTVSDGIRQVPPLLSRAGQTLGTNGLRLYLSVLLPAAMPTVISGLKVGWGFAWRSLMAAELIVNQGGLGFLLQNDRALGNTQGVLSTICVIILIGLFVQSFLFKPVEKRVQALWGLAGQHS